MAAVVVERFGSRNEVSGRAEATAERLFVIFDAADAGAAMYALSHDSDAASYAGMPAMRYEITDTVNNTTFFGRAEYGIQTPSSAASPSELPTPTPSISSTTAGGTQNIRNNISTVATYGTVHTDTGGAINYDGENINGVDIVVPIFDFEITRYYLPTDFNVVPVALLTGSVNSDSFMGFDPGSVLFKGSDQKRKLNNGVEGMWEVSYKFSMLPNYTGLTVGTITGIAKKGWEYLEIQYEDDQDSGSHRKIKKPLGVVIHQVYPTAPFSALGL